MPVIFLLSAIVSGIAVLIICYRIVVKFTGRTLDNNCLASMYKYLWGFLIIDLTLESLEVLTMAYEAHEEWHIISRMLTEKLGFSYIVLQMGICSVIPLVLLGMVSLMKMKNATRNMLGLISSVLILIQVLAMRWNVVVGGQLFSKSLRGLTSFNIEFFGREGLLVALILFAMPFVSMYIFNLILPVWDKNEPQAEV
jgi:formate-dependent nitrite reductase membrane component NrfD